MLVASYLDHLENFFIDSNIIHSV